MKVSIEATTDVELSELLDDCNLGQILKELPNVSLNSADLVGLGLFLNDLSPQELRNVAYGIDETSAKRLIKDFKLYGKGD